MVKTRLQSQSRDAVTGVLRYARGPVDCFRQILRTEGLRGLYRGLPPTLVGIVPEKGIKLAVNDALREMFDAHGYVHEDTGELLLSVQVVAAAGAGTCQVVATTPLEMIKIRKQTQLLSSSLVERQETTRSLLKSLGIRGLYTGTCSTLLRDVPYGMIFFPLYATLKGKTLSLGAGSSQSSSSSSPMSVIVAGASAGAVAAACVTPMDVLKTRTQMKGAKYSGIVDCFQQLVKEEGYRGLTRGIFPRTCV